MWTAGRCSPMCHPDLDPFSRGRTAPDAFVGVDARTKQDGLANPPQAVRWEPEMQLRGLRDSGGQGGRRVRSQPCTAPMAGSWTNGPPGRGASLRASFHSHPIVQPNKAKTPHSPPTGDGGGFNHVLGLTDHSEASGILPPGDRPRLPRRSVTAGRPGAVRGPGPPHAFLIGLRRLGKYCLNLFL